MAATADQAAFILSIPRRKMIDETQETLRTSAFPRKMVQESLHCINLLRSNRLLIINCFVVDDHWFLIFEEIWRMNSAGLVGLPTNNNSCTADNKNILVLPIKAKKWLIVEKCLYLKLKGDVAKVSDGNVCAARGLSSSVRSFGLCPKSISAQEGSIPSLFSSFCLGSVFGCDGSSHQCLGFIVERFLLVVGCDGSSMPGLYSRRSLYLGCKGSGSSIHRP
ncbi:hypothetical protein HAX54_051267 [Datura stramonium]|uniref:DUF7477 domain-containing protein n=1 Tax=Datura stramonium TaxID=4076 RepID=A0ABS8RR94_DATST|nr:hypothetical protein [Datura stramonium]